MDTELQYRVTRQRGNSNAAADDAALSSATGAESPTWSLEQEEDLQPEKNPFLGMSDDQILKLEAVLSSEQVKKILDETNEQYQLAQGVVMDPSKSLAPTLEDSFNYMLNGNSLSELDAKPDDFLQTTDESFKLDVFEYSNESFNLSNPNHELLTVDFENRMISDINTFDITPVETIVMMDHCYSSSNELSSSTAQRQQKKQVENIYDIACNARKRKVIRGESPLTKRLSLSTPTRRSQRQLDKEEREKVDQIRKENMELQRKEKEEQEKQKSLQQTDSEPMLTSSDMSLSMDDSESDKSKTKENLGLVTKKRAYIRRKPYVKLTKKDANAKSNEEINEMVNTPETCNIDKEKMLIDDDEPKEIVKKNQSSPSEPMISMEKIMNTTDTIVNVTDVTNTIDATISAVIANSTDDVNRVDVMKATDDITIGEKNTNATVNIIYPMVDVTCSLKNICSTENIQDVMDKPETSSLPTEAVIKSLEVLTNITDATQSETPVLTSPEDTTNETEKSTKTEEITNTEQLSNSEEKLLTAKEDVTTVDQTKVDKKKVKPKKVRFEGKLKAEKESAPRKQYPKRVRKKLYVLTEASKRGPSVVVTEPELFQPDVILKSPKIVEPNEEKHGTQFSIGVKRKRSKNLSTSGSGFSKENHLKLPDKKMPIKLNTNFSSLQLKQYKIPKKESATKVPEVSSELPVLPVKHKQENLHTHAEKSHPKVVISPLESEPKVRSPLKLELIVKSHKLELKEEDHSKVELKVNSHKSEHKEEDHSKVELKVNSHKSEHKEEDRSKVELKVKSHKSEHKEEDRSKVELKVKSHKSEHKEEDRSKVELKVKSHKSEHKEEDRSKVELKVKSHKSEHKEEDRSKVELKVKSHKLEHKEKDHSKQKPKEIKSHNKGESKQMKPHCKLKPEKEESHHKLEIKKKLLHKLEPKAERLDHKPEPYDESSHYKLQTPDEESHQHEQKEEKSPNKLEPKEEKPPQKLEVKEDKLLQKLDVKEEKSHHKLEIQDDKILNKLEPQLEVLLTKVDYKDNKCIPENEIMDENPRPKPKDEKVLTKQESKDSKPWKSPKLETKTEEDVKSDDNMAYSNDDNDSDWCSEDDPERLWCICRQPHDDRFMICCEMCEEWFHGDCVGISRSKGRQMKKEGEHWSCPRCIEKVSTQEVAVELKEDKHVKSKHLDKQKSLDLSSKLDKKDKASHSKNAEEKAKSKKRFKNFNSPKQHTQCILTGCTNHARPGSVYCSNDCILKHATESINLLNKDKGKMQQKSFREEVSITSKDNTERVIVLERQTGRLLTGPAAPTENNLEKWLEEHPSFEVVQPEAPRIQVSSHKFYSSKSKVPSAANPKEQNQENSKPAETKANPNINSGLDPIRVNVRKTLKDLLYGRCNDSDDINLPVEEVKKVALSVEEELFKHFEDTGSKYKAKYRSLMFNIKDPRNQGLFRKILKGKIKPYKLVRMSPEELASRELAKWREKEVQHTLDMIKQMQHEPKKGQIMKKTHKGEIEIETDERTTQEKSLPPKEVPIKINVDTNPEGAQADPLAAMFVDSTDLHKNHLFDLNCKICTGKMPPPCDDPTPKKPKVAHRVDIEEPKPKYSFRIPKKETGNIFEKLDVMKSPKHYSSGYAEPISEVSKTEFLSTPSVSEMLKRSVDSKMNPENRSSSVWKGFIWMQDLNKFVTTAYRVSGSTENLDNEIPDTIQICGRISPDQVWDYVEKLKISASKDLSCIRFQAANDEEKIAYGALYSYLNSRSRCGVVGNTNKNIKDMYIVPLSANSQIPETLLPFDGPGLENNRPHLLLGIIIRHKSRHHYSYPSPRDTYHRDSPKQTKRARHLETYSPTLPGILKTTSKYEERSTTPPLDKLLKRPATSVNKYLNEISSSYTPPYESTQPRKMGPYSFLTNETSYSPLYNPLRESTQSKQTVSSPNTSFDNCLNLDPIIKQYSNADPSTPVNDSDPGDSPYSPTENDEDEPYEPGDDILIPDKTVNSSPIKSEDVDDASKMSKTSNPSDLTSAVLATLTTNPSIEAQRQLLYEITEKVEEQKKLVEHQKKHLTTSGLAVSPAFKPSSDELTRNAASSIQNILPTAQSTISSSADLPSNIYSMKTATDLSFTSANSHLVESSSSTEINWNSGDKNKNSLTLSTTEFSKRQCSADNIGSILGSIDVSAIHLPESLQDILNTMNAASNATSMAVSTPSLLSSTSSNTFSNTTSVAFMPTQSISSTIISNTAPIVPVTSSPLNSSTSNIMENKPLSDVISPTKSKTATAHQSVNKDPRTRSSPKLNTLLSAKSKTPSLSVNMIPSEKLSKIKESDSEKLSSKSSPSPSPTIPSQPSTSSSQESVLLTSQEPVLLTSQEPIMLTSQEPGLLTTQEPIVLTSQEPVLLTSQESGLLTSQEPGLLTSQEPGLLTSQEPGLLTSQEPGLLTSQEPGLLTSQEPGLLTSQEPGLLTSQEPGLLASSEQVQPALESSPDLLTSSVQVLPSLELSQISPQSPMASTQTSLTSSHIPVVTSQKSLTPSQISLAQSQLPLPPPKLPLPPSTISLAPPKIPVAPPMMSMVPPNISMVPPKIPVAPPKIPIAPPKIPVPPPKIPVAPPTIPGAPPKIPVAPSTISRAPPKIPVAPSMIPGGPPKIPLAPPNMPVAPPMRPVAPQKLSLAMPKIPSIPARPPALTAQWPPLLPSLPPMLQFMPSSMPPSGTCMPPSARCMPPSATCMPPSVTSMPPSSAQFMPSSTLPDTSQPPPSVPSHFSSTSQFSTLGPTSSRSQEYSKPNNWHRERNLLYYHDPNAGVSYRERDNGEKRYNRNSSQHDSEKLSNQEYLKEGEKLQDKDERIRPPGSLDPVTKSHGNESGNSSRRNQSPENRSPGYHDRGNRSHDRDIRPYKSNDRRNRSDRYDDRRSRFDRNRDRDDRSHRNKDRSWGRSRERREK